MLKKIIYVLVALTLGFVFFYFSWISASSKAILKKGNKALEEKNIDFFLKFNSCYENNCIYSSEYTVDGNTTKVYAYNVYSKSIDDTSIVFIITDLNTEKIYIDEVASSSSSWDEEYTTTAVITANNGETWEVGLSTYGYEDMPIAMFTFDNATINKELKKDDVNPTKLTSFVLTDAEGYKFAEYNFSIDIVDYTIEEWNTKVENGNSSIGYTDKEYRNKFSFSYPEMWTVWITTGIVLLALAGLGLFVFWPKKDYTAVSTKKKSERTFTPTEEKKPSSIEAIAQAKKEKEERENRYKNVRSVNENNEVIDAEIVEDTPANNDIEEVQETPVENTDEEKNE